LIVLTSIFNTNDFLFIYNRNKRRIDKVLHTNQIEYINNDGKYFFTYNGKRFLILYVNYKKGIIPYTLVQNLKGKLSNFQEKTIGIICTRNKQSKNTKNEIKKYSKCKIAICNSDTLWECIKKSSEIY